MFIIIKAKRLPLLGIGLLQGTPRRPVSGDYKHLELIKKCPVIYLPCLTYILHRLSTLFSQEIFPSGFLFINNVFYVDTREGCVDYSEPIREWALKKGLGDFPKKDMCAVRLEDLVVKLGYPDVSQTLSL